MKKYKTNFYNYDIPTKYKTKVIETGELRVRNAGGLGEGIAYAAGNVGIGAMGIVEGVTDLVAAGGYALTGQTDRAKAQFLDSWSGDWKRQLDDWYNPNAVMSFVGDVGAGVGNSLVAAIPYVGLPSFFLGAAGGGISSAAEKTGEVGLKEVGYGLTSGIIEGMLEKYVGPGAASVKGIGTKALSSLTKNTAKSAVRNSVWKQVLSNMGEEFLEESLSEMIDPLMQRLYRIDPEASTSFAEVMRAGIIGGISGGILGGAQIGSTAIYDSSVGRTIAANGNSATVKHTAEAVLNSPFFADQNGIKDEGILELAGTLNSYNELTPEKLASGEGYRLLGAMKRQLFGIEARTKSAPYRRELLAKAEKTAAYATQFYGRNYTAEDIKADKDGILTNLTVLKWAGDAEIQARAKANIEAARASAMAEGGVVNDVTFRTAAEMEAQENGTDTSMASAEVTETAAETDAETASANSQAIENLGAETAETVGAEAMVSEPVAVEDIENNAPAEPKKITKHNARERLEVAKAARNAAREEMEAVSKMPEGAKKARAAEAARAKLAAAEAEISEAKRVISQRYAEQEARRAEKKAKGIKRYNLEDGDSDTNGENNEYDADDRLYDQLQDWLEGGGKAYGTYNGEYFELGETPASLTKWGARETELIMSNECVAKIAGGKHSISLEELSYLPSELKDPVLLFKGSVPNSFVAVTEIIDKQGNDVVVAIHINRLVGRNVINKIASVYSKSGKNGSNNIENYVQAQIDAGNLVDASKEKAPTWFTTRGLQLPKVVQTIISADNSIHHSSEKVNSSDENNSERMNLSEEEAIAEERAAALAADAKVETEKNHENAKKNDENAGKDGDSDLIPDERTERMLGSYESSVVEKARKFIRDFDLLSFERKVAVCELIDTSPNMGATELRAMCVLVAGRDGLFAYSSPSKHKGVHKVLNKTENRRLVVLSDKESVISGEGKGNVVGETIFHEITHDIYRLEPKAFFKLAKKAFEYVPAEQRAEIQDRYTEYYTGKKYSEWMAKEANKGKELDDFLKECPPDPKYKLDADDVKDIISEEIVAGYVGKALGNSRYLKWLGDTQPSALKRAARTFNVLFRQLFGKNRFAEQALIDVYTAFSRALAETRAEKVWERSTLIFDRYDEEAGIVLPSEALQRQNLAAVETHRRELEEKYTSASDVPLATLMERYDKIVEIWNELGGELDSEFLRQWNAKKKDKAFTVFKAQVGYKYNIELSSMCKKGVPLFEAIDTIVRKATLTKLGDPTLDKRAKELLYDILKDKGFEIPCAICYVEQARQREGVIIRDFLNGIKSRDKFKLGWNTVLGEIEAEMARSGVEYHFPKLSRDIAGETYSPAVGAMTEEQEMAYLNAARKLLNREIKHYNEMSGKNRPTLKGFGKEEVKAALGGTLPSNLKLFKVLLTEPSSRFTIDGDLLYSSVTTHNLAAYHTQLYSLFNSQGGVSGYKTKQQPIAYWGELLGKKWKLSTVRESGGIRNQSNSDGQMYTLLNLAQMYIDATAKGFYIQAYTKVLAELRLFGLSRAKINASLIPRVRTVYNADGTVDYERTQENAGLGAKGELLFDDVEGIPHAEALDIVSDPEYSKSVGCVCIGYSDNHILKLLDDARIQLVIGFHDKTDNPDKRYRGARFAKNYNGLNEVVNAKGETVHIGFNQFVIKAEKMFRKVKGVFTGVCELNGKTYEPDDIPRLAADLYLDHCRENGYRPAYSGIDGGVDFSQHKNYYKLLADFSLYDSTGAYAPHRKVAYNMPDTVPVRGADGSVLRIDSKEYIKTELQAEMSVRDGIASALADDSEDGVMARFERGMQELAEDSGDERLNLDDSGYLDAVESGDMETAQRMVDEAARAAGYDVTTYHGTDKDFTVFKTLYYNEFGYHVGSKSAAEDRIQHKLDGKVLKLYTKLGKTLRTPDIFGYFAGMHDYIFYVRGEVDKVSNMDFLNSYGRTKKYKNKFPHNDTLDKLHDAYVEFVESGRKFGKGAAVVELTQEYLKGIGIDSVSYTNAYEAKGSTSYLLMSPNQVKSADPVTYDDDGNVIPLSKRFNSGEEDIRYSLEDEGVTEYSSGKYSYDSLIKKEPLVFTEVPDDIPREPNGRMLRSDIIKLARKDVRSQNNSNNTDKESYVYIPDIGLNVRVSRDGIEHGLTRGDEDTALVTLKLGDILRNAVAINETDSRATAKKQTDMSYVLVSVAKNKNDSYAVRIVVDKNTNAVAEISAYGLYSVKAKEKGELFMPNGNEGVEDASVPYLLSTISIADFLEKVKDLATFNEIFSKDVAKRLGVTRSKGDITGVRYNLTDTIREQVVEKATVEELKDELRDRGVSVTDAGRAADELITKHYGKAAPGKISRVELKRSILRMFVLYASAENSAVRSVEDRTGVIYQRGSKQHSTRHYRIFNAQANLLSRLLFEESEREAFVSDVQASAARLSSALGKAASELKEEQRIHGYQLSIMKSVQKLREMLLDKRIGSQEADALVKALIDRITGVNSEAAQVGDRSHVDLDEKALARNLTNMEELINGLLHDLDEAGVLNETTLSSTEEEQTVFSQYVPKDLIDEIRACATRVAAKKGERITADEYELIARMMLGLRQWYKDYDLVFFEGQMRNRGEVLKSFLSDSYDIVGKMGEKKGVRGIVKTLMQSAAVGFLDTHAVWATFDGYRKNGLFSRLWDQLESSMAKQAILKEKMLAERDAFFRKHKNFELELKTRKVKYQGHEITLGEAITIMLTAKREQAFLALYGSDMTVMSLPTVHFKGKGFYEATETEMRDDIRLRVEEIRSQLKGDSAVTEYIGIAERFFNETSKGTKKDADERYFGYTNVEDGYYIPISRDKSAFSPDMLSAGGQMDQFVSVASLPFNKHLIKKAKAALVIGNINDLINRHADGLSKYATMYQPVNAVNRLLGKQITVTPKLENGRRIWLMEAGKSGSPQSLMKILTDAIWEGDGEKAKKYFRDVLNSAQGFSQKQYNAAQKLVDYITKNATVNALGLNIKSVMSQLAGIPLAGYAVSPSNLLKGLTSLGGKVRDLKAVGDVMDRYSEQAHSRNIDGAGVRVGALTEKMGHSTVKAVNTLNKISEATMTPISATDRLTFLIVWEAAQYQAEASGGHAIGTEENRKMAGKIVDEFAKMTQPTVSAANSAAARTDNVFAKAFMRFTSANNKMFSRMVEGVARVVTLKDAKKNGLGGVTDKEIKEASAQTKRLCEAVVVSQIMLVGLVQLFKLAFAKDRDEDETVAEDVVGDIKDSFIGLIPVVSQINGLLADGYEISDLSFDAVNDTFKAMQDLGKITTNAATGEAVESTEVARVLRNAVYNIGAMSGIPVRNTWNNLTGLIKRVSPSAGANINAIFYDPTAADLTAALGSGNEALAETLAELMLARRGGKVDYTAAQEFLSLYSALDDDGDVDAYGVMPRTAKDEISVDGKSYILNAKQYKAFKQVYGGVASALSALVTREDYKTLSEKERAKAVKSLYSLYYSKATTAALGTTPAKSEVIASFVSDVEGYVSALAYASGIEGDGRKDKILAYLKRSGLSVSDQTWVLASLGYKAEKEKAVAQIRRSSLTEAEKANAYNRLGVKGSA